MSEYHSREHTKRRVLLAVATMGGQRVTRLQIAKTAGLRKSPYLLNILIELVESGYLVEIQVQTRIDQTAKAYNLTEKGFETLKTPE